MRQDQERARLLAIFKKCQQEDNNTPGDQRQSRESDNEFDDQIELPDDPVIAIRPSG